MQRIVDPTISAPLDPERIRHERLCFRPDEHGVCRGNSTDGEDTCCDYEERCVLNTPEQIARLKLRGLV
jgi:hypothetical protein